MNDIERQVLRLIGESPDSPDVFTDDDTGMAPIRDSISDAIEEIHCLTGGYTQTFLVPLVADGTFYRLNFERGSFGWVRDAWLAGNRRRLTQTSLTKLAMEYPGWLQSNGTPEQYFHLGRDLIGVFRKPSSSSDVLEINAVVIPGPYADGERIKLKNQYHWAAVHYAVGEFWASRGDAGEAARYMGLYQASIGLFKPLSVDRNYRQATDAT